MYITHPVIFYITNINGLRRWWSHWTRDAEVSLGPVMIPLLVHHSRTRASFRRRCPLRSCTRRSASSRRPCAAPTAVNPRHSGAFRCPIRCSGSPASTCWRDASSSIHHRRQIAVVALWPLLLVASSCVLCACFGTKL